MFDVKDFRTENKAWLLRAAVRDDRPALPARRPPARDASVAAVRDGRDGSRPHPPRLLEVHGRRAPKARAGQRVRGGDPRLLQARRRAHRAPARARRRRDARARRLRSRREAARRRHPRQRVAAPRGAARARGGAERRRACRTRSGSTGRARRPGGTAATTRASSSTSRGREPDGIVRRRTTRRVRDDLAQRLAAIPDDAGPADGDARLQARGAVRRGQRCRARPDRRLRRSPLALGRRRSAATRACTRSRTTPAPTTRTTRRTG